jgi:hypothetical protein
MKARAIRTVGDLIKDLKALGKGCEDWPLVAASDDEGNAYNVVYFSPTTMENVEVYNADVSELKQCVCIN